MKIILSLPPPLIPAPFPPSLPPSRPPTIPPSPPHKALRDVHLDGNPLKEMPSTCNKWIFVRTLNLSGNQFTCVAFVPRHAKPQENDPEGAWEAWEKVNVAGRGVNRSGVPVDFVWYNNMLDKTSYVEREEEARENER